jgi:spore maturation protein SpmA
VLNYIWLALVLLAVAIGGWNDRLKDATNGALDGAKTAVTIALGLWGIMALWLGVMRLAERAGLVQRIAYGLRPLLERLFPEVPPDHPAMGSMLMNMAANMLGLGNAATPLGLRAMRDLESMNPRPGIASNAMCTFLAINTSSVQLIPATAIAILAAAGSARPTVIVGTAFFATLCAATVAVLSAKFFERLTFFQPRREKSDGRDGPHSRPRTSQRDVPTTEKAAAFDDDTLSTPPLSRPAPWGLIALVLLAVFFVMLFLRMVMPDLFRLPMPNDPTLQNAFARTVNALSILAIPFLLSFFPIYAAARGIRVYDEFVEGAKEAFNVILRIIPFLVTMLVGIGMFKGAGGIDLLTKLLSPILTPVHFPTDLVPLALMRPLSGSATLALLTDVVHRFGPDNIISLMAATIYGSTETTFYVAAVYFGSVGIKQTRHAIPAGLLADLTGVIASVIICRAVL